jgi:hypothetical protein
MTTFLKISIKQHLIQLSTNQVFVLGILEVMFVLTLGYRGNTNVQPRFLKKVYTKKSVQESLFTSA